jgi:translation initiation factor IF-3
MDLGQKVLECVISELEDIAVIEARPKMEGRSMFVIVSPKK